MYKATNIDTDKALEAIESFRRSNSLEHQKELYGIQKYYEGLENSNREYTVSELCKRMAELERQLNFKKQNGED